MLFRSLFRTAGDRPLPDWATDLGATTWAQVFLKYAVSHPAVVAAIPGTDDVEHVEDNMRAGHGKLPDEALRREIERYWDQLAETTTA